MASFSVVIKTLILFLLVINFFTFIYVWQINSTVQELREKVQKLVIEKEISQISIETDFNSKQASLLREIGKHDNKKAFDMGRLKLEANEPQRLPIAKLQEANSWMANGRRPRAAEDPEAGAHAFQVIKVPGSKNFKVVRVSNDIPTQSINASIPKGTGVHEGVGGVPGDEGDSYLPVLPGENVVSMSLWGKDRRYTVGAIRNAETIKRYFPGWKLRIYTEAASDHQMFESVPKNVMDELRGLGVDIEFMDPRESRVSIKCLCQNITCEVFLLELL